MKWLIVAVVLLALTVLYLVRKTAQLERAAKPSIHLLAANAS